MPWLRGVAVLVLAGPSWVGCSGDAFSTEPAGTTDAGTMAEGAPEAAREAAPKPPVELNLPIAGDADDATWINGTDERLRFGDSNLSIEVGVDSEMGRAGLRFSLPIPPGATIDSARIRLRRTTGAAAETETMQVQVFDTANVPPFDEAHVHAPSGHASIWSTTVSGFLVGADGDEIESPELKALLQHVLEAPDAAASPTVGFVLSPDRMQTWVAFADSAGDAGRAVLRVVYTPP
jgi:hypothetical protein